ncbi:MAG: glycosyltransferase [Bacteroidota bacterium]
MNKRILIINDAGVKGGGAENRVRSLLKLMLKDAFFSKVCLISSSDCEKDIVKKIKKLSFYKLCYNFSLPLKIKKIIKQNQINLIQFHNLNFFQVISLVYPYFKKIPMVFFLHDFWPLCVYRNFMNPYEDFKMSGSCEKGCIKCVGLKAVIKQTIVKFIINRASVGIAPGKNIKNICENKGLLKGKWEIVIPWIKEIKNECNEYLMKNKNIFFVGPLLPYKGAWVLAKASKHIKTKDAAFHFIGQNQEESSVFFSENKTRI